MFEIQHRALRLLREPDHEVGRSRGHERVPRAIAIAESEGAATGLAALDGLVPPGWLERSYQWDAVLADLHRRAGNGDAAAEHRERALAAARPTLSAR